MNAQRNISVIIPFHDEEGNVDFVLGEVVDVLKGRPDRFEIIAVDDGSRDRTGLLLKAAAQQIPQLKVITHPKKLGQCAAFRGGFGAARGEVIITMDGDGQNDFRDVPPLLPLLDHYEAVFTERLRRNDPAPKLVASRIAFFFRRLLLNDRVRDAACGLKLMKKNALRCLVLTRGFHRFIPFMFQQAGISYTTVGVNHRPRTWGKTKYSLLKGYFLSAMLDLIFMWWYKQNNIFRKSNRAETDICAGQKVFIPPFMPPK